MARKKHIKTYKYSCSITEETYTTTQEAPHPDDLMSISAYYQLNPEEDDRPAHILKGLGIEAEDDSATPVLKQ